MNAPVVYDKAKYHAESVAEVGLAEGQEFVHTGMYLAIPVIVALVIM
jgi:hypothetical protein